MTAALPTPEIPPESTDRLRLRRREVAKRLGCSEKFVDGMIRNGTLRAKTIGRTVFVSAADVRREFGDGEAEISDHARTLYREMA